MISKSHLDPLEIHEKFVSISRQSMTAYSWVIEKNGPQYLEKESHDKDILVFLLRTIVGQQLSKKAAHSLWGKIQKILPKERNDIKLFIQNSNGIESLTNVGLSKYKARAFREVTIRYFSYPDYDEYLLSLNPDEMQKEITSVWGLGNWSADMVSMFYFNIPNVWPNTDGGLINALSRIEGRNIDPKEGVQVAQHFSPFRSFFALHLWSALDAGFI
jgi:DNA-3-methyladenine glycosylase II